MKFKNLSGLKFGRLSVLSYLRKDKHGHLVYSCECECGNKCNAIAGLLKSGLKRSCGCLLSEWRNSGDSGRKHNMCGTPEYWAWAAIKSRCNNPKTSNYNSYGGRGIRVCKRWLDSFEFFLNDMGLRPSAKHSIDRKNNDGNYTPKNCRWATKKEQANNKSTNRKLSFNNLRMGINEWERHLGFNQGTIKERLHRGWGVKRSLTAKLIKSKRSQLDGNLIRNLLKRGKYHRQIASIFKVSQATISRFIQDEKIIP